MDLGGLSTSTSRWCPKCKEDTERYIRKDGRLGDCKICILRTQAKNRANNPEKFKEANRKYKIKNREKIAAKKREARKKGLPTEVLERERASRKNYRENNKHKAQAHSIVWCAIERGDLPRADTQICIDCGCNATEYHHEDYTKPLEVLALCRPCHRKRHLGDSSVQHPAD